MAAKARKGMVAAKPKGETSQRNGTESRRVEDGNRLTGWKLRGWLAPISQAHEFLIRGAWRSARGRLAVVATARLQPVRDSVRNPVRKPVAVSFSSPTNHKENDHFNTEKDEGF